MIDKSNKPSVTIIGTGALGASLGDFFLKNGIKLISVWNSKSGRVYTKSGDFQHVESNHPIHDQHTGTLVFITTPDDVIAEISDNLAGVNIDWGIRGVVHCSGNLTSEVLDVLAEAGAGTATMHPIQTFTKGDNSERFRGITFSLEGEPTTTAVLEKIVERMDARFIHLTKNQKRAVHIAAVFASNYMVSLMHGVGEYLAKEGIDNGLDILKPLITQTAQNIIEKGAIEALTGPVSRGDMISIQTHLRVLESDQELLHLYQLLGKEAVRIADKRGEVSKAQIKDMLELFSS